MRDPKSAQHVISQSAIINVKYMSNDLESELRFWFTIVSLYMNDCQYECVCMSVCASLEHITLEDFIRIAAPRYKIQMRKWK